MSNEEVEIKEVLRLLSIWIVVIRANNGLYWYDANKVSESLALKLLNLIYDLQLVDLNEVNANFPGLDLGDFNKKIAFQISSRTDTDKVISTLRMSVKKGYDTDFSGGKIG